jgi:hypothetical protein
MKEKAIEVRVDGCKLVLDVLKLVSSLSMIRVPPTKVYSNFDLTNVKCNTHTHTHTYKQSREPEGYGANKAQELDTFRKYKIKMTVNI